MTNTLADAHPLTMGCWDYSLSVGHFDEAFLPNGELRSHWKLFAEALGRMGDEEFARRWERGKHLIHENGVTYNIHGDEQGLERPWPLDAVPLLIAPAEWMHIERAIAQRARLLNEILNDLYGPQRLLHEGRLPSTLIFGHSAFLRPLHGVPVPNRTYLHIYAADLARSADGRWWVVSDRTQAPSGMGYALENRLVLRRTLPDVFKACRVRRLAEFFGHLNESIVALAPQGQRSHPHVVLLTPGPFNETYFEHAYLARYLGYTLAEAGDLTVRDRRVWLKTLEGLLPVDVILRRTDDAFCDPLELREDSVLGIPGLVDCVRAGNVAIANALGSSLAQAAGLAPFLEGLARHMLGEELLMPNVATWWCGQESPRHDVCSRIRQLVIKSANAASNREPIFGESLDDKARKTLIEQIAKYPREYVAQEQVRLSTAPAWDGRSLANRHVMLRVFAAARMDGTWDVMPGGLSRVASSPESSVVSMQRGGGSKDTWMLSDVPVNPVSPLRPPNSPVAVSRGSFVLPSRVADDLFWLGRYIERAEFGIRVARTLLRRMAGDLEMGDLPRLLELLSGRSATSLYWTQLDLETRVLEQLFSQKPQVNPRPIQLDIAQAHRIASSVRDRLSYDAWRIVNQLVDEFVRPDGNAPLACNQAIDVLDRAMITLAAFAGQSLEGFTHDKGWHFLDIGRRIERAIHLVDLLHWSFIVQGAVDPMRLEAALEIGNSTMTYRSRYRSSAQSAPVLDLLMVDDSNPRSLAFQLVAIRDHVQQVPSQTPTLFSEDLEMINGLLDLIRRPDLELLVRLPRVGLADMLGRLAKQLPALSVTIERLYLIPPTDRIQMDAGR